MVDCVLCTCLLSDNDFAVCPVFMLVSVVSMHHESKEKHKGADRVWR